MGLVIICGGFVLNIARLRRSLSFSIKLALLILEMVNSRTVPSCLRACSYCRMRKVKCDGAIPCSKCIQHDKECFYLPSLRGKRKERRERSTLEDRLARMEALLQTSRFENPRPRSTSITTPKSSSIDDSRLPEKSCDTIQLLHAGDGIPSSLPNLPPLQSAEDETIGVLRPQLLGIALDISDNRPPKDTSPSWIGAAATTASTLSFDSRNLGELECGQRMNWEDRNSIIQTKIWEHHGE